MAKLVSFWDEQQAVGVSFFSTSVNRWIPTSENPLLAAMCYVKIELIRKMIQIRIVVSSTKSICVYACMHKHNSRLKSEKRKLKKEKSKKKNKCHVT